jgi:MOSC domain-containing protein YiiM
MRGAGVVAAVCASARHGFSKAARGSIRLLAGLGVEGDAHAGATTRHRYLVKKDPGRKNLTQVHLLHAELFEELAGAGFSIAAGAMGENVTTSGVDLLTLPVGTKLHLGEAAVVEVTGLREPCSQLNALQPGLMKALIAKDAAGRIVRKAGIMGVVLAGGEVRPGDAVRVELPPGTWVEMGPV